MKRSVRYGARGRPHPGTAYPAALERKRAEPAGSVLEVTNEEAHRRAREKGVSRTLYAFVRGLLAPFMRLYFRMHISGAEHIPAERAAIIAPNHKSFFDSFFIAVCTRRHVRFMAKSELIEARYGPLLVRLGAFPVRRGHSDADALETARVILGQGGLLALFPEGTRIRDPGELGHPKRGAGRLALDTGAPLIPCAITGTEKLFAGPVPKPRRVQVAFSEPIPVHRLAPTPGNAGELIETTLWPQVEDEYRRLRAGPQRREGGRGRFGTRRRSFGRPRDRPNIHRQRRGFPPGTGAIILT